MARFRLALQTIAIVACACGSTQKPYNPFKVPRESFYPALKTVALAPVRLPGDLEDPEPVRALFAGAIEAKLKNSGIAVVPGSDVGPIIEAKTKEAGGVFDPTTGKADEAKVKALNAAIGRERSEEHTSELQSRFDLVCRLLLEKKKRERVGNATQHMI